MPRRRRSSIRCPTTSSPATSRPRPGSPAWSSTSTGTPRATRTPMRALAVARATGQGELFLVLVATLGGALAPAGEAGRGRPSCSTAGSRRRACWATRTRSSGRSSSRSSAALRSGRRRARARHGTGERRSQPRADSDFHSAEAAADLAAALLESGPTGTGGRAARRLRRRRGADAHRRQPEGPLPGGAGALLARARPPRRGEADSSSPRRRGPRPCSSRWPPPGRIEPPPPSSSHAGDAAAAAERALASAAAADEVGAPVEAALSRTLAGRALAAGRRVRPRRCRATARGRRFRGAAARFATATRPSASCESSATTSTVARAPGKADGTGVESMTERELAGRSACRRPQDESRDRGGVVPQPEDGRDAPAQHLPQARRRVARRTGPRRRTRGSRRAVMRLDAVS